MIQFTFERLNKSSWYNRREYLASWAKRNRALLELLSASGIDFQQCSFSEYGCGPEHPFREALKRQGFSGTIAGLDMKAWDSDVITVDLDAADLSQLPDADVGVLSGVVEYLCRPEQVFTRLAHKHEFLVFSYHVFQFDATGPIEKFSRNLARRAANGWKNHLNMQSLLDLVDAYGYIFSAGVWNRQSLFILRRW